MKMTAISAAKISSVNRVKKRIKALASVTANTQKTLRLVELQVTARRLTAGVELAGPDLADAIPKALGDHRYFAGRKARMQLGAMSRKQDATRLRDLEWGNNTLLGEIDSLEERIRELEAEGGNCELRRTGI